MLALATNRLRRSGRVEAFWRFIDRSFARKIEHESHLTETILRLDSQHKADAYLTALSGTLPHPGRFLTKMLFLGHAADSLFSLT
ncbi:hypothetical protein [Raoultella planticola]|uniref:hypothetical protein n=1 Tax=Raoultella planticola TaxID=575 RepID=UPI00384D6E41